MTPTRTRRWSFLCVLRQRYQYCPRVVDGVGSGAGYGFRSDPWDCEAFTPAADSAQPNARSSALSTASNWHLIVSST
jgi:hypothetical protein